MTAAADEPAVTTSALDSFVIAACGAALVVDQSGREVVGLAELHRCFA